MRERPGRGEADRQVAELGQQLLEAERAARGHGELGGDGWASFCPSALVTPGGAAGHGHRLGGRRAPGARWRTKAKVSGVTSCQTPATAGLRVGVGEWALSGAENCTVMVASLGTWVVAVGRGHGDDTERVRMAGRGADLAVGDEVGEAAARPECPRTATTATATPTTATTVTRVTAMNQPVRPVGRRFWARLSLSVRGLRTYALLAGESTSRRRYFGTTHLAGPAEAVRDDRPARRSGPCDARATRCLDGRLEGADQVRRR